MEKEKMQKKMKAKKLVTIGLLAILLAGIAYAVIQYTSPPITNTGNIMGYEVQLFRLDTNQQVTAIAWGNVTKGARITTDQLFSFTQKLVLKNTGDYNSYFIWLVNGTLPTGLTLTAQYYWGEQWHDLPQSSLVQANGWNQGSGFSPGSNSWPVQFILTVVNDAPKGPFTFDIVLESSNT